MGLTEEERQMARPKIAAVRDLLNSRGSMDMNPFFTLKETSELVEIFQDLAADIRNAAGMLSKMTGVDAPVFEDASPNSYLADGLIAASESGNIAVEVTLSEAFSKAVIEPYMALRALEKNEADGGVFHCPEMTQEAMNGMVALHAVAKAVPLVYKQISQGGRGRTLAVA